MKIVRSGNKAEAWKREDGTWDIRIRVWVGVNSWSGHVVVPFGYKKREQLQHIIDELNAEPLPKGDRVFK